MELQNYNWNKESLKFLLEWDFKNIKKCINGLETITKFNGFF